jgi:hypothetical protein
MSNARYFDEDSFGAEAADDAVQSMARRQLAVSLVVACALAIVAGMMAVTGTSLRPTTAQVAAQHRILKIEAPRLELAQPSTKDLSRG